MSAVARYEAAVAPDGWLTPAGWLDLAADLDAEHAAIVDAVVEEGGTRGYVAAQMARADKLFDRAEDCRSRAADLCRGAA